MQINAKDEYTKYTIKQNDQQTQTTHKAGETVSGSGMLGDMVGGIAESTAEGAGGEKPLTKVTIYTESHFLHFMHNKVKIINIDAKNSGLDLFSRPEIDVSLLHGNDVEVCIRT